MPKGVEHINLRGYARDDRRVESLMPKGVEHEVVELRSYPKGEVSNL